MLDVGLATVYTSCMLCGFLPRLIYLRSLIKKNMKMQYISKVGKLMLIHSTLFLPIYYMSLFNILRNAKLSLGKI